MNSENKNSVEDTGEFTILGTLLYLGLAFVIAVPLLGVMFLGVASLFYIPQHGYSQEGIQELNYSMYVPADKMGRVDTESADKMVYYFNGEEYNLSSCSSYGAGGYVTQCWNEDETVVLTYSRQRGNGFASPALAIVKDNPVSLKCNLTLDGYYCVSISHA